MHASPCARLSVPLIALLASLVAAPVHAGPGSAAPAAAASSPRPSAPATCGLPRFEEELLERINTFRAAPRRCGARRFDAAEPLRWDTRLARAAAGHAHDMARGAFLSHTGPDGRDLDERVEAVGYAWTSVGENIAGGPDTVQAVMARWQASPDHCANLMNPNFRDVGAACVAVPWAERRPYDRYWSMSLGRSR